MLDSSTLGALGLLGSTYDPSLIFGEVKSYQLSLWSFPALCCSLFNHSANGENPSLGVEASGFGALATYRLAGLADVPPALVASNGSALNVLVRYEVAEEGML
jgi:hypothetical protein